MNNPMLYHVGGGKSWKANSLDEAKGEAQKNADYHKESVHLHQSKEDKHFVLSTSEKPLKGYNYHSVIHPEVKKSQDIDIRKGDNDPKKYKVGDKVTFHPHKMVSKEFGDHPDHYKDLEGTISNTYKPTSDLGHHMSIKLNKQIIFPGGGNGDDLTLSHKYGDYKMIKNHTPKSQNIKKAGGKLKGQDMDIKKGFKENSDKHIQQMANQIHTGHEGGYNAIRELTKKHPDHFHMDFQMKGGHAIMGDYKLGLVNKFHPQGFNMIRDNPQALNDLKETHKNLNSGIKKGFDVIADDKVLRSQSILKGFK